MKAKVNIINTCCIIMSGAVTVPNLKMMTLIVSDGLLARDTHTHTHARARTHTYTHTHTRTRALTHSHTHTHRDSARLSSLKFALPTKNKGHKK